MFRLRNLATPDARLTNDDPQPINKGGTGSRTISGAIETLSLIPKSLINQPNGILAKVGGIIPNDKIDPSLNPGGPNIVGPTTIDAGVSGQYTISNYDSKKSYSVTVDKGTVSRNEDIITYTAPTQGGMPASMVINGKVINIDIRRLGADKPSIVSPVNNTTGIKVTCTFTSSDFKSIGGVVLPHTYSDWELATDPDFTNVVQSSLLSTTNKTTWVVTGLLKNTQYYVRTRHHTNTYGYSEWSTTNNISTRTSYHPAFEVAKLLAGDGAASDNFGISVAISSDGNTAIVGSYFDDNERGTDAGSSYIFTRSGSTWTQQAKLIASDGAGNDQFGRSVAISGNGNTAIVGSYRNNTSKGSAYIYTRSGSTWTQQAKIAANDAVSNDWFGFSVSISNDGNTAIVGAYVDDNGRGSAYIFTRSGSTWTQQAKLVASDAADGDWFGYSLAISGDGNTAIVGARNDDSAKGSAYIYTRTGSTWTQQAKLIASDGAGNDRFGFSVAISGDGNTVILGAYLGGSYKGAAYVYTRTGTTWSEQTRILASDGASSDYFGWSVSISSDGNTAIVSAHYDDNEKGTNAGGVYVYTRTGTIWTHKTKLVASDGAANDNFGVAVAISSDGNTAIVGTNTDDNERGTDAGSAYIFY